MDATTEDQLPGNLYEVMVSCSELADLDEFTKSDPMCVLFHKQFGQWKEVCRTEAIRNTLNPKFVKSFILDFDHSLPQNLMFSVYDIDNSSTDLGDHDFVGSAEFSSSELIDPKLSICTRCKTLRVAGRSRGRGIISVTSERIVDCKEKVTLHAGAHKLNKRGRIISSKPDSYLEISRSIDNVSYQPVFRSETVFKSLHPRWRPVEIGMQRLCNGDWDRPLELSIWHHSGTGDYKMLGRKVTTLRELKLLQKHGHYKELSLVPRKGSKRENSVKIQSCGYLRFFLLHVACEFSLLHYIQGGLTLNLLIAIDFTSSNGKQGEVMSLHDISNEKKTPYVEVIESLGGLISPYCPDENIFMMGFGAKTRKSSATNHCFTLPISKSNTPYLSGIQSAVDAYRQAVTRVRFSGPTRLRPVITHVEAMFVREPTQERQAYTVLLIITDGVINDYDDVIERLISISHLPISVIFAGVGPADFSVMECFSHTSLSPLSLLGKKVHSPRRHTHFVAFPRENGVCSNVETLARETFAILSKQTTDYLRDRDITPNPPRLRYTFSNSSIRRKDTTQTTSPMTRVTSRASLVSRNSVLEPTCPTCGSVLESNLANSKSMSDLVKVG